MDWRDKLLEHLKSVPQHSYMDYNPEPKTKGDVVREYAAKHNIPLVNLPLVQIEVSDLYGCVVIGPSDTELWEPIASDAIQKCGNDPKLLEDVASSILTYAKFLKTVQEQR